jgi:hypothetical protein
MAHRARTSLRPLIGLTAAACFITRRQIAPFVLPGCAQRGPRIRRAAPTSRRNGFPDMRRSAHSGMTEKDLVNRFIQIRFHSRSTAPREFCQIIVPPIRRRRESRATDAPAASYAKSRKRTSWSRQVHRIDPVAQFASITSRPTFVTIANAPPSDAGRQGLVEMICRAGEPKYFRRRTGHGPRITRTVLPDGRNEHGGRVAFRSDSMPISTPWRSCGRDGRCHDHDGAG